MPMVTRGPSPSRELERSSQATAKSSISLEGGGPQFFSEIVAAANDRWHELIASMGITVLLNGKHGPCSVCCGRDSFRSLRRARHIDLWARWM